MATIVPGLFGKSSADVAADTQKKIDEYLAVSRMRSGPGSGKRQLGASTGILLGQALKGLFDLKTPQEVEAIKNKDMSSYLNQISSEEEKANPYKYLSLAADVADKFGEPEKAQNLRLAAVDKKMDYDKNLSTIDYQRSVTEKAKQEVEKNTNDYLGLVAYGANEALQNTDNPASRQKIWDNVLKTFETKGKDISMYKDLPSSEWEKALEMVSTTSTDVVNLKKLDYAALKEERAKNVFEETQRHNLRTEFLTNKRIDIMYEIAKLTEGGKDKRAKEKELSDVDKLLNKTTIDAAWVGHKSEINNLGNKIMSRELKSELKAYTELEGENLTTGFADFKANYSKYLNQVNDKGFPLYTIEEAKALALKDVKNKITEEGMIFKDKVYTPGAAPIEKQPKQELTKPLVIGKTYYDTSGNGAIYKGNNQWEELKK